MGTKVIPLRELAADLETQLSRCSDSGEAIVVELPDKRQLRIEPLAADDDLVDDLIANNADFQALLDRSAVAPRKPFVPSAPPEETAGDE